MSLKDILSKENKAYKIDLSAESNDMTKGKLFVAASELVFEIQKSL